MRAPATITTLLLTFSLASCAGGPQEQCLEASREWIDEAGELVTASSTRWNPQGDRVSVRDDLFFLDAVRVTRDLRTPAGLLDATEIRQGTEPDGNLLDRSRFVYDERGQLVGSWEDVIELGDLVGRRFLEVIENDDRGLPRRVEIDEDGDGTFDEVVESRYNPSGELISRNRSRPEGRVVREQRWRYTAAGLLAEYRVHDSNSVVTADTRLVYDYQAGNLVRTRRWMNGELETETEYRWDDGLLVEEVGITHPTGDVIYRTEHVYDDDPWPALKVTFDGEDIETSREELTWDDRGNPLTRAWISAFSEDYEETRTWTCFVPEPYPDAE